MMWITILYMSFILDGSDWGFFAHRLINRVAVYTLPSEMIGWYKPNIDYIAEHAVDPDKRRYATPHEAVRHYIDLDQWGTLPFDHVPKYWDKALALNIELYQITGIDTVYLLKAIPFQSWNDTIVDIDQRLMLVRDHYLGQYYEDEQTISCASLKAI